MVRKHQHYIIFAWLGLPIAFFFLLGFIIPGYEGQILESRLFLLLFLLIMVVLEGLNFLALSIGFLLINRYLLDRGIRPRLGLILQIVLSTLTFVLFTVPALYIVFVMPAISFLLTSTPLL
jgi:hypothetical protein